MIWERCSSIDAEGGASPERGVPDSDGIPIHALQSTPHLQLYRVYVARYDMIRRVVLSQFIISHHVREE